MSKGDSQVQHKTKTQEPDLHKTGCKPQASTQYDYYLVASDRCDVNYRIWGRPTVNLRMMET